MDLKLALQIEDIDNVATVFADDVKDGDFILIKDKQGNTTELQVLGDIPFGHKIAVKPIGKGGTVIKYGESIGRADADIGYGEYVHVHNMEAMRGRGDL